MTTENKLIYLMVASAWNPNTSGVVTVYFGTEGFATTGSDSIPNVYFEPRITNPGMFAQSMFSSGTTGGQSTGGYGVIGLANPDGGLDYLKDYGFDGYSCQVYEGKPNELFSQYTLITTGTIEQVEFSWDSLSFRFKDRTLDLDKPIALNYYLGTNATPYETSGTALEGRDDLKDKPKPRLFGKCRNVEPILVCIEKRIYQVNDGAVTAITETRDSGISLTAGVARATLSALLTTTPAAGAVDTYLAGGLIRLGSEPLGQITMDVTESTTSVAQTAKILVEEKLGANSTSSVAIANLDIAIPPTVIWGYYTGGSDNSVRIITDGKSNGLTTKQVIDDICSIGAWWGFDTFGLFWIEQFAVPNPADNPSLTIDKELALSVARVATNDIGRGVVAYKVSCKYARNYTPQTNLPRLDSIGYAEEFLTISAVDNSVKTLHKLAQELTIETPFYDVADAQTEATRQLGIRSVDKDRLKIAISRYAIRDSVSAAWSMSSAVLPAWDARQSFVLYGSKVYMFGGLYYYTGNLTQMLDLSNIGAGWTNVADAPGTAAGAIGLGIHGTYLYAIAGRNYTGTNSLRCIRLDLENTGAGWDDASVTDIPSWAGGPTTILIYNNWLYSLSYYKYPAKLDLTAPSGAWVESNVINLHPVLRSQSLDLMHNNWFYTIGGYDETNSVVKLTVDRIDMNDPFGNSWEVACITDLPHAFCFGTGCIIDNWLYIVGGTNNYAQPYSKKAYKFNLSDPISSWVALPDVAESQIWGGLVEYNNTIYNLGGSSGAITADGNRAIQTISAINNTIDISGKTEIGKNVKVKLPRYGYNAGKVMKVIGCETNNSDQKITLDLWG